jgi:Cu+-exporting ATPase
VAIYEVEKAIDYSYRNQELIPVDGILISEKAEIDYSFVTGEIPITKQSETKFCRRKQ